MRTFLMYLKKNLKNLSMNKKFTLSLFIFLLLYTLPFSREFFIDIPKGMAFTIEYSRIVRQFGVEKNQQITDYTGKWNVYQKIAPPSVNVYTPFSVPTLIRLTNGITISDTKNAGMIYLKTLTQKENTLSEKLYETDKITFTTFPWEFENGYLEVKNREYQIFLPVYITNLGYQNKLDDLMTYLNGEEKSFRILLDENLRKEPPTTYTNPPEINLNIPIMSKKVKMVRAKLQESILLMENTKGIWNTPDFQEKDSSLLFEAVVPGTYTVKFTSTEYIMDYFITVK